MRSVIVDREAQVRELYQAHRPLPDKSLAQHSFAKAPSPQVMTIWQVAIIDNPQLLYVLQIYS